MPRKWRVEYPGALYHVMSRGDRREEGTDEAALGVFRRGRCLGSEQFRKQMLDSMEGKLGEHHSGELRRENGEVKAQRLIAKEMGRLGWTEAELEARRKGDPSKLAIAARLRKETTLSMKAIASLVHLGASKGAKSNLHKWMRARAPENPAREGGVI